MTITKTYLDGVNDVLIRLKTIDSVSKLTNFQFSSQQHMVDVTVQVWAEMIDELYSKTEQSRPYWMKTITLTLQQDVREYPVPDDFVQTRWPLQRTEKGFYIREYEKGYVHLISSMPQPDIWKGQPNFAVIRPDTGNLYLDRIPQQEQDGWVYEWRYDREFRLENPTDILPLPNLMVYTAMVASVAEIVRLDTQQVARPTLPSSFARAAKFLRQAPPRMYY